MLAFLKKSFHFCVHQNLVCLTAQCLCSMKRSKLTSAGFILTILIIVCVAVFQHGIVKKQQRLLQQVMQINSIHEELARAGDEVYTTPLLFLLTKDSNWLVEYHKNTLIFSKDLKSLRILLPQISNDLSEIEASFYRFNRSLEGELQALSDEGANKKLQRLLVQNHRLAKLQFDSTNERLKQEIRHNLTASFDISEQTAAVSLYTQIAMLLLICAGWWLYVRARHTWQMKLNAHYKKLTHEAMSSQLSLDKANRQLRDIFKYLHEIREKEKAKVAYDLHEQVCQQLSAIKAKIEIQEQKLKEERQTGVAKEIRSISEDVETINRSLRNLAVEMYPSLMDDIGLVAALEEESRLLSERHMIQISFYTENEGLQLPHEQETLLFRVYQGLLNRAIKRGATEIVSTLMADPDRIILFMNDNATVPENYRNQLQMIAIDERLAVANGSLEVQTYTHGTDHTVSLPVSAEKADHLM